MQVTCGNTKCDRRSAGGFCGRAYPCSEFQCPTFKEDSLIAAKMIEQGNVTPLKELHRKCIQDYKDEGYNVSICQDEITVEIPAHSKEEK